MPFPKAKDYHKPGTPLVPNCYGIFYAIISVCYWYILSFFGIMEKEVLALTTSVLFGSTMGLFDDLTNLAWRYKAVLPVFTSLPYMVLKPSDRTAISLLLIGIVEFGTLFFIFLVPIMVTVVTNSYNQLGGLNGLESIPGLIILVGASIKANNLLLTIVPILCLAFLAYISYIGKAFIGNVGTFSIGLTLVVYAILMDIKLFLLIALTPHIVNSLLILFSNYIFNDIPTTYMNEDGLLYSKKARSLRTLILSYQHLTEHQVVIILSMITTFFTCLAFLLTGIT